MLLATSVKILGIANIQTGQARRELLASKFKPEYQKLCKPENPFQDGKFFGPTFDTVAALVTNENRVQKTVLEQAPFKKKSKTGSDSSTATNATTATTHTTTAKLHSSFFRSCTTVPYAAPTTPTPQPVPAQQKGKRLWTWKRQRAPLNVIPVPHPKLLVGGRL